MSTWNPNKGGSEPRNRRSQRVILSLPIMVRTDAGRRAAPFEEPTQTLVVNAHGALIALAGKVEKGETLRVTNNTTKEEKLCNVMYVGPISDGKAQVGIEFKTASPDFWRIAFPPENWTDPELSPPARKTK